MAQYIYHRNTLPLVQWSRGVPPRPTRAADNIALGDQTIIPGGPEAIGSFVDDLKANFASFAIGGIAGAFLWSWWKKRSAR